MGSKHIVPYGLYAAKGYISPAFAEKTGFTDTDLALLFQALLAMFEHDRSAARGEMIVRGLYDFEHVGTQHENNAAQNKREAASAVPMPTSSLKASKSRSRTKPKPPAKPSPNPSPTTP